MPGSIIYKGPSVLDQQPIFATALWGSRNVKTGDMLQTYIMRSDLDPLTASKLGEDVSICGDCQHRGVPTLDPERKQAEQRACYVNLGQGPTQVWKAFQRDAYPLTARGADVASIGAGRFVRLGTYGDPAAVPPGVWATLLSQAKGWTGYTHNGGDTSTCMVSADSLPMAQAAWSAGHRTFRIVRAVSELQRNEVLCPASAEAGHKATCYDCRLCAGTSVRAKSVAIVAHGSGRNYV